MTMGKVSPMFSVDVDPLSVTKRVYFRPSTPADTVRVGSLVCYNYDISGDYKERSTTPISGGTAYAEGSQNYTGRLFCVEKPATANLKHFAGVVVRLGDEAGADGDLIEICPLNGSVVPVYVDANCVLGETIIGVLADSYTGAAYVLDGENYCQNDDASPLAIGIAMEEVDRDTVNGLVWIKLFNEIGVSPYTAYFEPIRATSTLRGYAYGIYIDGTKLLRGTTISKSYVVNITGDREAAYAATGDSNDAYLKVGGSNYATNDTNFIFRGINCNVANRSGGVLNLLTNNISVSTKSGSTQTSAIGLQVDCQHQSADTPTELGGLDVAVNFEGGEATLEYGIQIRTRGNCNVTVDHALYFAKGTYGFTNFIGVDAAATLSIVAAGITTKTWDASDIAIPILVGATTYYLFASDSNS